jgi:hypothetical protein
MQGRGIAVISGNESGSIRTSSSPAIGSILADRALEQQPNVAQVDE